jgi:MFS family permease
VRWALLVIAYVGLFYLGVVDNARGPIYPHALKDLGLTSSQGSWLFALTSLSGLFITLLTKHWLKLGTSTFLMKASWPIMGAGVFLIGYSYDEQSYALFLIGGFLQGIGAGVCGIIMNLIIAQATTPKYRRRFFGGLHGIYGVASLTVPFLYQKGLDLGWHWSTFYKVMALAPLALIPLCHGIKGEPCAVTETRNVSKLLKSIFGGLLGLYVSVEIVVSSRLVLLLLEGYDFSHHEASANLSLFFLLLMAGRFSLLLFNYPFKGENILRTSLGLTLIFLYLGLNHYPIFLSLSGLTMSIFFPTSMDLINELFPKNAEEVMTAAMSGIGFFLVAMHLGFGQMANIYGVKAAMGSAIAMTVGSAVLFEIFIRMYRRPVKS